MTAPTVQAVCPAGVHWCTSCTTDITGEMLHRAIVTPSEFLRVEVELLTGPESCGYDVTFTFHVHDEPPLLKHDAVQVAYEILATVARFTGHQRG